MTAVTASSVAGVSRCRPSRCWSWRPTGV